MNAETVEQKRDVIFISKATPGDDEFVLWLAPRLEAAGYKVFADILTLEPGDRWRKIVTGTLQNSAIKMLLCCRDTSLAKNGVQEEIGIAEDLVKDLKDDRFIVPLRLEPYKKVFGIGELYYVDFVGSWARGLRDLLDTLERQRVVRFTEGTRINPSWEAYRKRLALEVEHSNEALTSNWLRIAEIPDVIRYYEPTGALDLNALEHACAGSKYAAEIYLRGFFSFANQDEVNIDLISAGKFIIHSEHKLEDFLEIGSINPVLRPREASNMLVSIFRQSWERYCRAKEFDEYLYSKQLGFHVSGAQIKIGKRVPWGSDGKRRSSMLRNFAKGKVWQFGVTAAPSFWPFPHFKLKTRVQFGDRIAKFGFTAIQDSAIQHKLRRSICAGWRNKQWHGRFMAYLEILSDASSTLSIPLSSDSKFILETEPVSVIAPVTTMRVDEMEEDAEEQDVSTLGNVSLDEDEQ